MEQIMRVPQKVDGQAYTSDPNDVIEVWWSIATERVVEFGDDDYLEIPEDIHNHRMNDALDLLVTAMTTMYPNLERYRVENGGFENQFCGYGPKADTKSGAIYEPFVEEMNAWEDEACQQAMLNHPLPDTSDE